MQLNLRRMSGEELLLLRVFGDPGIAKETDRELHFRGLIGPFGAPQRCRRDGRPAVRLNGPDLLVA